MEQSSNALQELRKNAQSGGGSARIEQQHLKGKQTARERIEMLLDPGSFQEIGMFAGNGKMGSSDQDDHLFGDGVVTGSGTINGKTVYIFSQDFTVLGGSVGRVHGKKIARVIDLATQNGSPLIGLNDSGGARIQEGINSLAAYGDIFYRNVKASGVIPQISIILGPCAGGAVYSPAITDFVVMVDQTSQMFITGPNVIKEVTKEDIDLESLGGSLVHHNRSGVAHLRSDTEDGAFSLVRTLLSYLPSNNLAGAPNNHSMDDAARLTGELNNIVPQKPDEPYDIHQVIRSIVDDGTYFEIQEDYAENIVVCFARLDGHVIGIVANQPDQLAGVIDINASDKAARFIRMCDSFHIPILTLVDTPGFLPGVDQEHDGIIRHGAKMIFAYAEATVPLITLILRKAYGGAYIVMGSKHLGGDLNLAWPRAEIAVMGPEGAVKIIHKKELAQADNPAALQKEFTAAYRDQFASPVKAAAEGHLDDIILPEETRSRLIQGLTTFRDKRKNPPNRKHGNIPL